MTNPLQILNALRSGLFGRKSESHVDSPDVPTDALSDDFSLQSARDEQKWRRAYSRLS